MTEHAELDVEERFAREAKCMYRMSKKAPSKSCLKENAVLDLSKTQDI